MNLPNKLTILRIILVLVMVIIAYVPLNEVFLGLSINMWIMNLIFIVASITDKLDGTIARARNEITTFGKFLDPLADKMLVLAAMIILVEKNMLPAVIPIIVVVREFAVSGYRLIAVQKKGEVIAANIWGKIKTVTQMIGIILMFLNKFGYGSFIFRVKTYEEAITSSASIYMNSGEYFLNIAATLIITISVIATIFSGYEYLKGGKELLKDC